MKRLAVRLRTWCLLALSVTGTLAGCRARTESVERVTTVADLHAVHAVVRVRGNEVRGRVRVSDGDEVTTTPDGRARLRLDDGTLVVVGPATTFTLRGSKLVLGSGKLFVQGGVAARSELVLGAASTVVTSSSVAVERSPRASRLYCAQGELVVRAFGGQQRVASGETWSSDGKQSVVAPEAAFEDWTGGLAVPWAGESGQAAIAELRGGGGGGGSDPGAPLVIRSQKIDVTIDGELAVTRTRATYFNGLDRAVQADVRLALPEGALLRRVARRHGRATTDVDARLLIARPAGDDEPEFASAPRLEWAGNGRVRGVLPAIESGGTLELVLEYAEWLSVRGGRATYRFPMAAEGEPPLIGELTASVDAERSGSPWLLASQGATVTRHRVDLRKTDVRPTGDLVVELAPRVATPDAARAYVMAGAPGEDSYVLVRTEVPERKDPGVTLALVVDTSHSVGSGSLETQRAVVDALLEGLGPRDSVVVLAADQTVRPLAQTTPKPVDDALRASIRQSLAAVRPGGASNLGLALQTAADVLDGADRRGSGMVVYIGDGRPTVGEPDASSIRRRLSQRARGVPRLGAVAVGPNADRWLLARLVTGAGAVYEVGDRADAARAGAALLADALEPTLRDVELELGPSIDRVYPREARAALAGGTISVVGRLRGKLPARIGFRFRDGEKLVEQSRPLRLITAPAGADVPRRWAEARLSEMAARGDGLEPGISLAAATGLFTPWTSFFFEPGVAPGPRSTPFVRRVEELSPERDASFAPYVDVPVLRPQTLLEPPAQFGGGVSLRDAAEAAVRRVLNRASASVRACRDARASVRPNLSPSFRIELSVTGEGRATQVRVQSGSTWLADPVVERCIRGVVEALPYFATGATLTVWHELRVPEARTARRTQCSATSRLSLPIKKSVWRAQQPSQVDAYTEAASRCELPTWLDRRELLLILLERIVDGRARLALASELDVRGESDAATFVRKETLKRATSFEEMRQLSREVTENEPNIDAELIKAYRAAPNDERRLEVVRSFLQLAPHSPLARRWSFALLEGLGRRDALVSAIEQARSDPFADAGLLALGASALRRAGLDAEGRRAFGELIERAPADPWTLAYVGDRLRAEGLFDEAVEAYESLARLVPDDAAVSLRLGLAHAAAGRLDAATRLLDRVTQTGGRGDDGRLGELSAIVQAVLLSRARERGGAADALAELERRLLQTPLPDAASVIVVEAPPSDDPLELVFVRERAKSDPEPADFDARGLGLFAERVERGEGSVRLIVKRGADAGPGLARRVRVAALSLTGARTTARLVTRELEVPASGASVELRWDGEALL